MQYVMEHVLELINNDKTSELFDKLEIKKIFESKNHNILVNPKKFWKDTFLFLQDTDINDLCFQSFQNKFNKIIFVYFLTIKQNDKINILSEFFNTFFEIINQHQNFYFLWLFEDIVKNTDIQEVDEILLECIQQCKNEKHKKNLILFLHRYKNIDWLNTKSSLTNLNVIEILLYDCIQSNAHETNDRIFQNLFVLNFVLENTTEKPITSDNINIPLILACVENSYPLNKEIQTIISTLVTNKNKLYIQDYNKQELYRVFNFFKKFSKSFSTMDEVYEFQKQNNLQHKKIYELFDMYNQNFLSYVNKHFLSKLFQLFQLFQLNKSPIINHDVKTCLDFFLHKSYYQYDGNKVDEINNIFYQNSFSFNFDRSFAASYNLIDVYAIPHGYIYLLNKIDDVGLVEKMKEKVTESFKKFQKVSYKVFPEVITTEIFSYMNEFSKKNTFSL